MPALYTCQRQGGKTVTGTAKWLPEEIDQMDSSQLIQMLSEMKQFANYCDINFYTPIKKLEDECGNLVGDESEAKSQVIVYGVATAICFILYFILRITHHYLLYMFPAFMTLGGAAIFIFKLMKFTKSLYAYKKRYPAASAELKQLYENKEEIMYGTCADSLISGYVVLPDYYLTESALDFMIHAIRNHRALTLGQAVNLFEQEKQNMKQVRILNAQLATQQRAAVSAAQAAAAAESAAVSANVTATNTLYNRK
ncbi:MAG: hypothetical protein J1F24_00500 [Oscillospiraceae bacterium]|nr:hypothetical protein [Oscillospiraceae bacterium]